MGEFTTRLDFKEESYRVANNVRYVHYNSADYVYSWRSRRTKHDLRDSDTGTSVGIRPPLRHGSLADVIADRNRYNADIARTAGGYFSNASPVGTQKRTSKTDLGNPFTSLKFRVLSECRFTNIRTSDGFVYSDMPVLPLGGALRPPEVSSTPGYFSSTGGTSTVPETAPSVQQRNARLNPVFFDMLPTRQVAQIGETVVSLLRGEFPSIIRNLDKIIAQLTKGQKFSDLSSIPRNAGGEYLNSVFGWQPLIRDFERAIRVLMTVDYLIYGSSYGRKRTIRFDSQQYALNSIANYNATGYRPDGSSTPTSSSPYVARKPYSEHSSTYDIRLSARLVPVARPTIGSSEFIRQAEDKIRQLGLWYPALGWDLLPYSWLIDWATSLGSSINNASLYGNEPGMVKIDYAWATSVWKVLAEGGYRLPGSWATSSSSVGTIEGRSSTLSICKTRFSATPYGFGLDLSGLSAGQFAILTALGLAKLP